MRLLVQSRRLSTRAQRVASVSTALALGALLTSGCGYRMVKTSELRAQQFAADSASMVTLQTQIAAMRTQCTTDSLRMAHDIAALRAATAPPPAPAVVPDSLMKARDAEILMLRDQLTKATAELERIKRRLASPRA